MERTLVAVADPVHVLFGLCVFELFACFHDGHEQVGVGDGVCLADSHVVDRELFSRPGGEEINIGRNQVRAKCQRESSGMLTRYSARSRSLRRALYASLTLPLQAFAQSSLSPRPENMSGWTFCCSVRKARFNFAESMSKLGGAMPNRS